MLTCLAPNWPDKFDVTALYRAAYTGRLEVAQLLLASGADVNAKVTIASGCRLLHLPPLDWAGAPIVQGERMVLGE